MDILQLVEPGQDLRQRLIEPEGAGCRLTEFLILGTDISVPFFLYGTLRKKSLQIFYDRAEDLWKHASALPR